MSAEREQPTSKPGPLAGFDIPADFSLPTAAEIEQILALGDRSWSSLLAKARRLRGPGGGRRGAKDGE